MPPHSNPYMSSGKISPKALDFGAKDASFGLNHVTCNFDDQSFLKTLCHVPAGICIEEINITKISTENVLLLTIRSDP